MLKVWFPAGGITEKSYDRESFDLMNGFTFLMDSQFDGTLGRLWKLGSGTQVEEACH